MDQQEARVIRLVAMAFEVKYILSSFFKTVNRPSIFYLKSMAVTYDGEPQFWIIWREKSGEGTKLLWA